MNRPPPFLDSWQKAGKMQRAADALEASYAQESTDTDAYRAAAQFKIQVHSLSNASLGRLYDILKETFNG